jgi:hypothetical protein
MVSTLATAPGPSPALAPPMSAEAIAQYQARAIAEQNAEYVAHSDRKILTIAAGVAISVGLTALLSAKSQGAQKAGAAVAGVGAAAAAGAYVAHVRMNTHGEEKLSYANALASVGASAPGIAITKGTP